MKNKTISLLLLFLLGISMIAFGCAGDLEEDNNDMNQDQNGAIEEEDELIEEDEIIDENGDMNGQDGDEQTVEGDFTGWIDNNSFEVMGDDGPIVIRTNPDVTMPDDELDGKRVRITYDTNDEGQNIIQSIEIIE